MQSTNDIGATSSVCGFEPRQKLNYFQFRKNYVIYATICLEYKFRKYQDTIRDGVISKKYISTHN